MEAKNWSDTALGACAEWPQSLRVSLNICLGSQVPMCIFWGEGLLLLFNKAWADLFNQHSSLLGCPARQAFTQRESVQTSLASVLQTGKASTVHNHSLPYSNDTHVNLSLSPIANGSRPEGVLAVAEKWESKDHRERYHSLFESMDEGYCIIEMIYDEEQSPVDYRFLEVNPSFEDHTGMEGVEGQTMRQIIPDHEKEWFEVYGNVDQTGEPVRFEQEAKALGRVFELYAFPFGDSRENQVAVLFQDITQRKKNQRSDALLSAIVEGSDDAIISKDLNGIITSWNPGAEKIFGYKPEEMIGESVTKLMPPDRVKEEEHILSQLRQGKRLEHFETIRQRKDGRLLNISLTISPITDSSGKVVGASKIARDITKRKETEKRLQELNETLEKRVEERTRSLLSYQTQLRSLASKLSKAEEQERHRLATELHDNLGQMLAVSKMKIDLLRNDQLSQPIVENVDELKELLDDALVYTRELMSDLKPPPSLDKEDVRASIHWVAQKMKKHGLEVMVEDDQQPKAVSNEIRITLLQCVRELLFNVIKHTEVRAALIRMSVKGGQIQINVEDQGEGFNPDENKAASSKYGGFGLFNIKERMDLLGGTINISSNVGQGTTVTLLAPLKDHGQGRGRNLTSVADSSRRENSTQKVNVLLVDDHKMMREGLRRIVEEQEDLVVVGEASDGKEAIKAVDEKSPDVIVMDIDMPVMNGIDATHQIMSTRKDLRVIGLSLHGHKSVVKSMRQAGASAYLTKNEAFETLCATIRSEAEKAKN